MVASTASCSSTEPTVTPPVALPYRTWAEADPSGGPTTAWAPERLPDAQVGEVRAAPAACGVPPHQLVGFRGRVGGVETLLQVDEGYSGTVAPVRPVEADLTGDGGLDMVGVLTCTRDGVALPDHLVLFTGVATPVTSFDLARAQKQKLAIVRGLHVAGGDVQVEWTGFDVPGGPVTQYVALVDVQRGKLRLRNVRQAAGARTIAVEAGSFMTADGNVHCVMQSDIAWCDVARTTWRPPASPGAASSPASSAPPTASASATGSSTPAASSTPAGSSSTTSAATGGTTTATPTSSPSEGCGARPWGRTFVIAGGRARRSCAGEQGPETTELGQPLTSWHRRGWDATVIVNGRRSAAMTPGSVMATSAIRCKAAAQEVTCVDTRTQATFTVGRTTGRVSSPPEPFRP